MFNIHLSYRWLRWTKPASPPEPLPEGVERFFVQTPSGEIEVLYAKPNKHASGDNGAAKSPMFFCHGGMGSAWVWLEYMTYLADRGVPCYAISLRGHGNSWHPSFFRMTYCTTRQMLVDDLVAGVRWAQEREGGEEVVLVGHSSGGGLSQDILSKQLVRAKALVLAAAVPGYGSLGVYVNWWRLDPWFTIRMMFHGWHPNSPLSHPALTRRVFFGDQVADDYVLNFQGHVNAYEAFWWPFTMMRPFTNPAKILTQISGWERHNGQSQRVLVLAGGSDRLMTKPIMQDLAEFYRNEYERLVASKKLDSAQLGSVRALDDEGRGWDNAGKGVRLCLVSGAGHHLQNDVPWAIGARKLLDFYRQL